jgi:hypothetical protein
MPCSEDTTTRCWSSTRAGFRRKEIRQESPASTAGSSARWTTVRSACTARLPTGPRDKVTLTDAGLFVPREWTNDPERCRRAWIPETAWKTPQTKFDLALEIVVQAVEEGIRFKWVSADGGYGENAFLLPLDKAGLQFMVDVHCDHLVWFEPPTGEGSRRRRVDEWAAEQPAGAWQEVTTREGTRGAIRYEVLHARVWIDAGKEPQRQWHLLVRREIETPCKIKYTLSNAPADMPLKQLSRIQGQRYWVERALQDGKSHSGLGDYQVRGWLGWHHHMAIVLMAMLFMLEERVRHGASVPMLSTADIERCSNTTCHAATPPSKSSSGYSRTATIAENGQRPRTAGDLHQSDKVELLA